MYWFISPDNAHNNNSFNNDSIRNNTNNGNVSIFG